MISINYKLYNAYKPFANFLNKFDLYESLYVVWAYVQNLQFDMPIPSDITYIKYMQNKHSHWRRANNASEWELEYLTKEIIINCDEKRNCKESIREFKNFRKCIKYIRQISEVSGAYLTQENTLKELYRLTHRQFIWQPGINGITFIRYYKIFSQEELNEIFKSVFGMDVKKIMKIGMLLYSHYFKSYFIQFPIKNDKLQDLTEEDLNHIAELYSTSIDELKKFYKENQKIDIDIFYYKNLLRFKPLIKVNKKLICPLPTLFFWQITQGLYYYIIDKKDLNFDNAFGQSFQDYTGSLVKEVDKSNKFSLYQEMEYEIKKGNKKKTCDWIIESEDSVVLIECKTKRIRLDSKILLIDETSINFDIDVISDAVVQLYKQVFDYKNNVYPWLTYRDKKFLYPIIVTLENWYLFNIEVHEKIVNQAKEKLENLNLSSSIIDDFPFTVFSIEEFEIEFQKMEFFGIRKYMLHRFNIEKEENIEKFEPNKLLYDSILEILMK